MNKAYWEEYYKKNGASWCSDFATFCSRNIPEKSTIIDLGCGNGRDSYYFSRQGHSVVGVDYSVLPKDKENVKFIKQNIKDFVKNIKRFDCIIYSRFLLHAVDNSTLTEILKQSRGLFFAEARSIKDKSFVKDHKRNLIEGNELILNLIKNKFKILYFKEGKNMAMTGHQNPIVIRVIAEKYND